MVEWRSIPAKEVAWSVNPVSCRAGGYIEGLCRDSGRWEKEWGEKTLGDIAEMGRREWLRARNVGVKGVAVIEWVIDEAAEGRCPLRPHASSGPSFEAYIPKCERGE